MKNIVFGAIGRHNFGDLLFPHIIQKMNPDKSFTFCDLIDADMTPHGGHKVESIFKHLNEPTNVIHVGGEVATATLEDGIYMHLGVYDHPLYRNFDKTKLGYLLEKGSFRNPGKFIANAIGGTVFNATGNHQDDMITRNRIEGAKQVLNTYDLVSHRDLAGGVPDSAVMTRELFGDKIESKLWHKKQYDYIAVQIEEDTLRRNFNTIRDILLKQKKNVVFFCAGTHRGSDSLEMYYRLLNLGGHFSICVLTDIWEICSLISAADALISTSLHARIIAGLYGVPRISISDKTKLKQYVNLWDGDGPLLSLNQIGNISHHIDNLPDKTEEVNLVDEYRKFSDQMTTLL